MIKRFGIYAILVLTIAFFLNACASQNAATAGDPVPGEKISDEGRVAPGTGTVGPNASVSW